MINRILQKTVEKELFKGKLIVIGARQAGRTTLMKQISEKYNYISMIWE